MKAVFQTTCFLAFLVFSTSLSFGQHLATEIQPFSFQPQSNRMLGTDSCVRCHKDGHRSPSHSIAGKEYSIWVNKDPHSCAYNVLFNDLSKSIEKKLHLKVPPHKNDLCLNCHSSNVSKADVAPNHKVNLVDGVGCESCHGGAENWVVSHQQSDWKNWSPQQKESVGFVNTDNLLSRTRKCVECHVGSEGRDVNHDLIAAGHPRLYFEMAAYQANMPRHWSRAKDLAHNESTAESKLWLVGQFATAEAALEQLERRAGNPNAPWPEFAEYGCFSCHHDLAGRPDKEKDGYFEGVHGKPAWGSWYFASTDRIAANLNLSSLMIASGETNQLRLAMEAGIPRRKLVVEITPGMKQNYGAIAEYLGSVSLSHHETMIISRQLFQSKPSDQELNWDNLTQKYLAAVALRQAAKDSQHVSGIWHRHGLEDSRIRLVEIRDSLKFIEDYKGPKDLGKSQRQEINRNFLEIFDLLKN